MYLCWKQKLQEQLCFRYSTMFMSGCISGITEYHCPTLQTRIASASQNIGVRFSLKRKGFGQCFQKRYPLVFYAFSQIPWNIAMNHSFGGRGEREGNILLLLTIPKKNYFGLGSYCSYFMEQKEHFHMDFYKIDKGLYYKKINAGSSKR